MPQDSMSVGRQALIARGSVGVVFGTLTWVLGIWLVLRGRRTLESALSESPWPMTVHP